MHEMSIAQSILDIALGAAQTGGGSKVLTIKIQAGVMRGIIPEQLQFCMEFLTRDTAAEGARLAVETIPVRGFCTECRREFDVEDFIFVCPKCEGTSIDTLTGMELSVKEIEVA